MGVGVEGCAGRMEGWIGLADVVGKGDGVAVAGKGGTDRVLRAGGLG